MDRPSGYQGTTALTARSTQLDAVEGVTLSKDGRRVIAMGTDQATGLRQIASVETGVGIRQPMEESSRQWFAQMEQQQTAAQSLQQHQARSEAMQQAAPMRAL